MRAFGILTVELSVIFKGCSSRLRRPMCRKRLRPSGSSGIFYGATPRQFGAPKIVETEPKRGGKGAFYLIRERWGRSPEEGAIHGRA